MEVTMAWPKVDVCISLDGTQLVLMEPVSMDSGWLHGTVSKGSIALTAYEAVALGNKLIMCANRAKELELIKELKEDL